MLFAVIYRGFIQPGYEKEFQQAWKEVADYFIKYCGALGSCLHKTPENEWIAYSRWPNRKKRDAVWFSQEGLPAEIILIIQRLKKCLDPQKHSEEIQMEIVEDSLFNPQ